MQQQIQPQPTAGPRLQGPDCRTHAAGPRHFRHPATSTGPARQRQQQQPAASGAPRWAHTPAAVLLRWRQDPRIRLPGTALTNELRTDTLEAIPRLHIGAVTPGAAGAGGDALIREVCNAAVTTVCASLGPDTFTNHALIGRGTAASVHLGVHAGTQAEAKARALLRTTSIAVPFRDTVIQVPVDSMLVPRQPHTHKLVICGLPGRFALEGFTAQLLHCAGLPVSADGSDPSAAAVAGELLGDQQGRRGTGGCPLPDAAHLVAFVHAPSSDPQLLALPRSFFLDQQTVRIRVYDLADAPPEVEGGGPFPAGPAPSMGTDGEVGPGLQQAPMPMAGEPMVVEEPDGGPQARTEQSQGLDNPAPTAFPGLESPAAAPAAAEGWPPPPALAEAGELRSNTPGGRQPPCARMEMRGPARGVDPMLLEDPDGPTPSREQLQGPARDHQQPTTWRLSTQAHLHGGRLPTPAEEAEMETAPADGPAPQPASPAGSSLPPVTAPRARASSGVAADRGTTSPTAPLRCTMGGGPTPAQAPALRLPSPDPGARRFQHLVSAAPRDQQGPDVSDIFSRFRAARAARSPARSPLGSADQAPSWRATAHGGSSLDQVLQTVAQDYARSTSPHRRAGVGSPAAPSHQLSGRLPGIPSTTTTTPSRQLPAPPQASTLTPASTTFAASTTITAAAAAPAATLTTTTTASPGQQPASPPPGPLQTGGSPAAGPLHGRPPGSTPTPSAWQGPSAGPLPPGALAALQAVAIAAPALSDWQPPPLPVAAGYVDALTDYLATSPHRLASSPAGQFQVMVLFVERHPHLPSPEDVDPRPVVVSFCRQLLAQFDSLQPGPLSDFQLDRLLTPAQRRSPNWRGEQPHDPALEAIASCLNSQSHQLAQHEAAQRTMRDLFNQHRKHLPSPFTLSIDRARHAHTFCLAALSQVDTRLGLPDSRSARPTRRPARGMHQ